MLEGLKSPLHLTLHFIDEESETWYLKWHVKGKTTNNEAKARAQVSWPAICRDQDLPRAALRPRDALQAAGHYGRRKHQHQQATRAGPPEPGKPDWVSPSFWETDSGSAHKAEQGLVQTPGLPMVETEKSHHWLGPALCFCTQRGQLWKPS